MGIELGEELRHERRKRHWTQTRAGEHFDVSQPSYMRWESGENVPGPERYPRVAEYLSITEEVFKLIHQGEEPTSLDLLREGNEGTPAAS